MNQYEKLGFKDRTVYLIDLAENEGVCQSIVFGMAAILGENEDFDGLVTHVQDHAMGY